MAGSMLVGFLAGLVVLNTVRTATELAANLLLGAGVMALAFTPLVFAGRAVAPRIPIIVVWVLGLALVATLLVIF